MITAAVHVPCFAEDARPAAAGSAQLVPEPGILGLRQKSGGASALSVVDAPCPAANVAILDTMVRQRDSGSGAAPTSRPDRLTFPCPDPAWTVEPVESSSTGAEPDLVVADLKEPNAHLPHFTVHRQPSLFDCV